MTYNNRSSFYKETSINTASPVKLVVMLYEGAIRFLTQAAGAMRKGDLIGKGEAVKRAVAIIQHLQFTLDMENGRDAARQLETVYVDVLNRALEGSTKLDVAAIEEAIKVLSELLPAWEELARNQEQTIPPAALLQQAASTGGFRLHA